MRKFVLLFLVLLILVVSITSVGMASAAVVYPGFTPQINSVTVDNGITVEGAVTYYGWPVNGIDVTMRLETPDKRVIAVNQVQTGSDGKFKAKLNPADPYRGEATIYVAAAGNVISRKVII